MTNDSCAKRRYGSEHSAKKKLRELQKRRARRHNTKIENRVYHCPKCGAWHLTSQPREGRSLERP